MRYVGIDPSTKTGVVVLKEDGEVVKAEEIVTENKRDPERFMEIAQQVINFIGKDYKVIIEGFSFGSKGKGVSTQYGIGWAIRMKLVELRELGFIDHYIEVSPGALKKFAAGKGNIKKDDLILPIYKKWGFENDSDNIRDAFVLAQIGRYMDGLETPTKYQEDVLKKIG